MHDGDGNRDSADAFREKTDLELVVEPDGQAVGGGGPQQSEPTNQAPSFDANTVTTLAVAENSPAGTGVGAPITATDPDEGDTLTYSLSGTDASSFEIGSSTGQKPSGGLQPVRRAQRPGKRPTDARRDVLHQGAPADQTGFPRTPCAPTPDTSPRSTGHCGSIPGWPHCTATTSPAWPRRSSRGA